MGAEATARKVGQVGHGVPWQTPEDRELKRKHSELSSLVRKMTFLEMELVTTQSGLSSFELKYHRIVGRRYVELDLMEAHLAGSGLPPGPAEGDRPGKPLTPMIEQAWQGRVRFLAKQNPAAPSRDIESLKRLYREVAKHIHPDLGLDEADRLKRQSLMAEANGAYKSGDGRKLKAILLHWRASPESVVGDGPGVELVRVIRRLDQVWRRIRLLSRKLETLKRSELYRLKTLIEENECRGRDLLSQMAAILDEQISRARTHLRGLTPRPADD
jgi:hypothetical protein